MFVSISPPIEDIINYQLEYCVIYFTIYPEKLWFEEEIKDKFPYWTIHGPTIIIREQVNVKDHNRLTDIYNFLKSNLISHNYLGELVYRKNPSALFTTYFKLLDILKINTL